jgi:hypothetical protein
MTMHIGVRSLAVAIGVTFAAGHAGYAQQKAPTDMAAVVGRYEFGLTPQNGERITGKLVIRVTKGAWRRDESQARGARGRRRATCERQGSACVDTRRSVYLRPSRSKPTAFEN